MFCRCIASFIQKTSKLDGYIIAPEIATRVFNCLPNCSVIDGRRYSCNRCSIDRYHKTRNQFQRTDFPFDGKWQKGENEKNGSHAKLTTCVVETMHPVNKFLSCRISKKKKHNYTTINTFSKTHKNDNGNIEIKPNIEVCRFVLLLFLLPLCKEFTFMSKHIL